MDNKEKNGAVEKQRLQYLIDNPKEIFQAFKLLNPSIMPKQIQIIGGRSKSYDFIIIDNNDIKYTLEHKGFCKKKNIDCCAPWIGTTPQIANISGNDITLSDEFANYWYTNIVSHLKEHYSIEEELPTLEAFKNDIYKPNPISNFGKLLKQKIKQNKKYATDSWYQEHIKFIKDYWQNTDNRLKTELEIKNIFTNKLKAKDYWLNIQYLTPDSITPLWEPKDSWSLSKVPKITSFEMSPELKINKKSAILVFGYTTSLGGDKKYYGEARMRFRNNINSNLSWNITG